VASSCRQDLLAPAVHGVVRTHEHRANLARGPLASLPRAFRPGEIGSALRAAGCRRPRGAGRSLRAANGVPSWKRTCYRLWLQTPSEGRRKLLGQAGVTEQQLARMVAVYLGTWAAQERAGAA
jgi:hypothetical protein